MLGGKGYGVSASLSDSLALIRMQHAATCCLIGKARMSSDAEHALVSRC